MSVKHPAHEFSMTSRRPCEGEVGNLCVGLPGKNVSSAGLEILGIVSPKAGAHWVVLSAMTSAECY